MELLYTGQAPARAYPDDAGLDLYVVGDWVVPPGGMADIDLGCAIKSPSGHWTLLTGRSSTLRRRGLLVPPGIIDPGYTGPLYACAWNMTQEPVEVKDGERLAQLIVFENRTQQVVLTPVQVLPATARGAAGFGSSGA